MANKKAKESEKAPKAKESAEEVEASELVDPTELQVWIKKNGNEIRINSFPDTIAHAKAQGWKRK